MPKTSKPAAERAALPTGVTASILAPSKSNSKVALVVTMLERSEGAALADLAAATGWLPHTTRAALTRLRQKGHAISKASREGQTIYGIAAAPSA